MTNEDAIKILEEIAEALNLAIKALEFINENFPESFKDYLNGNQYRE